MNMNNVALCSIVTMHYCIIFNCLYVLFQAHMKFPPDYPYSPPSIRFLTKVWHPNVYEVCVKISLLKNSFRIRFQYKQYLTLHLTKDVHLTITILVTRHL